MKAALPAAVLLALLLPSPGGAGPAVRAIAGSETWAGEVLVDGVVVVREEGELTVAPGTIVRFLRRDVDGDGIGDGEIRVEGRIAVRGTEEAPVLFTSAAEKPAPADWKYLMVDHARGAKVEYAVFRYAYSGIQIHYTRGVFSHVVCRDNVDGFRFSTAPAVLEDSLLTGNENGIRFEERGAGASIRRTIIARNRVGIFPVVKCRGLTVFAENVIEENDRYNVKMGERQTDDLPLGGNWWGGLTGESLAETFFDGRRENGLGKVLADPPLPNRPGPVGPGPAMAERWSLP